MKGGYQILDLKNTELMLETPTLIEGVYEHCDSNGKPVMITGLTGVVGVGAHVIDGAYVSLTMDSNGTFVGTLATVKDGDGLNVYTISISMSDMVTINLKTIE